MKRKDFIELWCQALESGEYKQGKEKLVIVEDGENKQYCCLGVACVISNDRRIRITDFEKDEYLPKKLYKFLGMDEQGSFVEPVVYKGNSYSNLAYMNDAGVRFKTIARVIREQFENKNFRKP